jgi:hypothetical protein
MSDGMVLERLARLEPDWADVEQRSRRLHTEHLLRKTALSLLALAAAAILAGGAYAAARTIWSGHDLTPADIARQETVVTNDKWSECDGHGHCKDVTGTHKEVDILPSMGVVFVLPADDPSGEFVSIVPAEGILSIPSEWGGPAPGRPRRPLHRRSGASFRPLHNGAGIYAGGRWTVPLAHGGRRTITWHVTDGSIAIRDTVDGTTTTTTLHAGDVVPLIPGSLAHDPRTLDKAVTFDLPTANRVIIFPELNETYVDDVSPPRMEEPLAPGVAAKYGLTPIGRYNGKLPVTASGGTWTTHLPGGLTRTITWHAGNAFVTVGDTTGGSTSTTRVPIGHELPLVPFK